MAYKQKKKKKDSESRVDKDRRYAKLFETEHFHGKTSIIHLAAQRNLTGVAKAYLKYYPHSIYVEDIPDSNLNGGTINSPSGRMPVEWAIVNQHDDVCCFLIAASLNERYIEILFY